MVSSASNLCIAGPVTGNAWTRISCAFLLFACRSTRRLRLVKNRTDGERSSCPSARGPSNFRTGIFLSTLVPCLRRGWKRGTLTTVNAHSGSRGSALEAVDPEIFFCLGRCKCPDRPGIGGLQAGSAKSQIWGFVEPGSCRSPCPTSSFPRHSRFTILSNRFDSESRNNLKFHVVVDHAWSPLESFPCRKGAEGTKRLTIVQPTGSSSTPHFDSSNDGLSSKSFSPAFFGQKCALNDAGLPPNGTGCMPRAASQ